MASSFIFAYAERIREMPNPVSARVVSCVSVNTIRICIPRQMRRAKAVGADPVKPRGGHTSSSLRGIRGSGS
ncbi:hypothetical protein MRX96_042628 [Rhipicephalus microplus]